ncbi:pyochelin biosynthetic protein PchC [Massilia sp. CF038]|nr:pyochelin biosynthetic protein PchC [Massilia sp. CF038]
MGRYRSWRASLPDQVKVVLPILPGREGRLLDLPHEQVSAVTDEVMQQLAGALAGTRIAIAGLSYGALLAYDLAARLEAAGHQVEALFVASQRAPTTAAPVLNWHAMDQQHLLDKLRQIDGLEANMNEEFLDLFLPVIRADLRASETYLQAARQAPLRCPIYLYHGSADPAISAADAAPWCRESGQFFSRSLEAGHFLLGPAGDDLWLEALQADLATHVSVTAEAAC